MKKTMSLTIRSRMIISYLVVLLVPCLIIGGVSYSKASKQVESELMHSAQENVKAADSIISQNIKNKITDIEYFGNLYTADAVNEAVATGDVAIKEKFKQYLAIHKDALDIYIGTSKGKILLGSNNKLPEGFDPRKRDWYVGALKQPGKVNVSSIFTSIDGNPVVSISKTLPGGDGVVSVNLNLSDISEMTKLKVGKEGFIVIFDSAKKVLNHPLGKTGEELKEDFVGKMFQSDTGTFDYQLKDKPYKMSFQKNELTGWRIGGTLSQGEVAKETSGIRNTVLLVMLISMLGAGVIVFINVRSVIKPLQRLKHSTKVLGAGDLTEKLDGFRSDEIGELATNFQLMVDNLRSMVEGVQEMTESVSASAEELSAGAEQTTKAIEHVTIAIQDVAVGSEQQLRSVENGMSSVDTMTQQVNFVSGNIQDITQTMSETSDSAKQGTLLVDSVQQKIQGIHESVGDLSKVVDSLNQRATQIGSIVSVMGEIAVQTNLLALNASIEAARAGEQGRGFAVVASEVRKLAEGSGQSADQIKGLIGQIQVEMKQAADTMEEVKDKVSEGIIAVDQSGKSFSSISESVVSAAEVMRAAAATMQGVANEANAVEGAIDQIRSLSEEAAGNTQTISAAAEEQLASVEEIASSSADLSKMAEQLQELVGRFKVYKDE
ncbi:methyl-accepting chemotaxis protein [Paenibacillus puldeungensis]|uniref:Methyl-accepting chemotaxis protein n=1 Tax=Paenibacillus puldeungensis TaxID=696536 RepID=A0ABW3RRJ9_9BACL